MPEPARRVGWVQVAGPHSGGHRYGEEVRSALSGTVDITLEDIRSSAGPLKPIVMQARLASLRARGRYDWLVLDNAAALAMPLPKKPRHLVIVYHIGVESIASPWERALFGALEPLCLRHLRAADQVVTISKFWENRVRALGNPRVRTISSGFRVAECRVEMTAVEEFRERHGLTKPIVYIGNCQPAKGVIESYEALRDLEVHLVTSGRRMAQLPALNLDLSRSEYLTLLAASSVVVTMSKFDEGWCRTAHEAMLLGRPVIGSGRGGMRELLEGGGQIVCETFQQLRGQVKGILRDSILAAVVGDRGRTFAQTFTLERFQREWTDLAAGL